MDAAARAGPRAVRPVRNAALPAGRAATGGELAALLAVAYVGGLRRAEPVALAVADSDRERDALRVLHGKGGRQRAVSPAAGAVAELDDWLAVRDDWPGPLFVPGTRGGNVGRRPLNPQTVYDVLRRRTVAAGVAHLSPHDLRRTFAGDRHDPPRSADPLARVRGAYQEGGQARGVRLSSGVGAWSARPAVASVTAAGTARPSAAPTIRSANGRRANSGRRPPMHQIKSRDRTPLRGYGRALPRRDGCRHAHPSRRASCYPLCYHGA